MSKLDGLIAKYSENRMITGNAYKAAIESMSQEEFEKKYFIGSDNIYYMRSVSEEHELVPAILDRIEKHVAFIAVVAFIGLAAGVIYILAMLIG